MMSYLSELRLSEYFSICAVLGEHLKDRKKLFCLLGEIFLQPQAETEELFKEAESEALLEIDSEGAYFRHCRIRQYCTLVGIDDPADELTEDMIALKGNAISLMKEHNLLGNRDDGIAATQHRIIRAANSGSIAALRMLGLMQTEGIFTEKNGDAGLKNLEKAASWNNVEGLCYALYYAKEQRGENVARLELALTALSQTEALKLVKKAYPVLAKTGAEAKLIEKAFKCGFLQREIYSPQYARIIFSETIQSSDKERLLFATPKEMLSEMSEIPLKLSQKRVLEADGSALERMPLQRESERKALSCALRNFDLRRTSAYRPICLSYGSEYVKNVYLQGVSDSLGDIHIELIEVGDLIGYDLEPTKSHIFVRSCNEHQANVYVLVFRGEIEERVFDHVKSFLQSDKRCKFRLNRPSVCIDLGSILPICICDKGNERKLKRYCDVISLADVTKAEMPETIASMLREKADLYGLESVEADEEACEWLYTRSADEAEALLDKSIRLNRNGAARLTLTKELIGGDSGNGGRKNSYGFGGAIQ